MILEVSCTKSTVIPNLHALFAQECLLPSSSFTSSWLVCAGDEAAAHISITGTMLTPRFPYSLNTVWQCSSSDLNLITREKLT